MLKFQEIIILIVGAMIIPAILGIMSTGGKKGIPAFTAIAGILAALPIVPIIYYFITTFLHHPELYATINWTAFLVLTLQFVTISLAMIDAIVLGGAFKKEPVKTILYIFLCIGICSAFFFGLDHFNNNMNQVHFVLKDILHSFDQLSKAA